jgi:hypothetical protein
MEGVCLLARDIADPLVGAYQERVLQQEHLGHPGNAHKLGAIVVGLIDTEALGLDPQHRSKGHQGGVELIALLVDGLGRQAADIEGEEHLSEPGLRGH